MRRVALLLLVWLAGCSTVPPARTVAALEFRPALEGWWDSGPRRDFKEFCTPGRTLHRHVFSDDGTTITWEFERPRRIYDGSEVTSLQYRVLGATSVSLVLALDGETRKDKEGRPLVWELVMVDNGMFRWRATTFPPGVYSPVWARRCRASLAEAALARYLEHPPDGGCPALGAGRWLETSRGGRP
jgi:hypothetical protein